MKGVAHICMAMHAGQDITIDRFFCFRRHVGWQQRVHEVFVTADARVLSDRAIAVFNLDRIWVVAHGKRQRVEEAVVGLGDPLANSVMRKMTVVANGNVVMTTVLPCLNMFLHNVTVRTRLRIVAEIASTISIAKSECANASEQPQGDCKQNQTRSKSARRPNARFGSFWQVFLSLLHRIIDCHRAACCKKG